jgi:hypothetical protein
VSGAWRSVDGATQEVLELRGVGAADAGLYRVEAQNAAGGSSAQIAFEVFAASADSGGVAGGGGTSGGADGGTVTVGTLAARWWVYDVASGVSGETPGMLPSFWVHDRVLQRSAWVTQEAGTLAVSAWEAEEQQVVRVVSVGGTAWEVTGLRSGGADSVQWDGFELSGALGDGVMPALLGGSYAVAGDGTPRAVELFWNASRTHDAARFADWSELLRAICEEETPLGAAPAGE